MHTNEPLRAALRIADLAPRDAVAGHRSVRYHCKTGSCSGATGSQSSLPHLGTDDILPLIFPLFKAVCRCQGTSDALTSWVDWLSRWHNQLRSDSRRSLVLVHGCHASPPASLTSLVTQSSSIYMQPCVDGIGEHPQPVPTRAFVQPWCWSSALCKYLRHLHGVVQALLRAETVRMQDAIIGLLVWRTWLARSDPGTAASDDAATGTEAKHSSGGKQRVFRPESRDASGKPGTSGRPRKTTGRVSGGRAVPATLANHGREEGCFHGWAVGAPSPAQGIEGSTRWRLTDFARGGDGDERQFDQTLPPPLRKMGGGGGARLTGGRSKAAAAAAARQWPTGSHTNSQDRAAGVAINRQMTDARAEPALSQTATGNGQRTTTTGMSPGCRSQDAGAGGGSAGVPTWAETARSRQHEEQHDAMLVQRRQVRLAVVRDCCRRDTDAVHTQQETARVERVAHILHRPAHIARGGAWACRRSGSDSVLAWCTVGGGGAMRPWHGDAAVRRCNVLRCGRVCGTARAARAQAQAQVRRGGQSGGAGTASLKGCAAAHHGRRPQRAAVRWEQAERGAPRRGWLVLQPTQRLLCMGAAQGSYGTGEGAGEGEAAGEGSGAAALRP
ncbi:hypothetical protein SVAN01_05167, partial [Stagonosporopsis vannaccii]